MTEYRRRYGRDTWHWVKACRWWPKASGFVMFLCHPGRRPSGDLCNECRSLARRELKVG